MTLRPPRCTRLTSRLASSVWREEPRPGSPFVVVLPAQPAWDDRIADPCAIVDGVALDARRHIVEEVAPVRDLLGRIAFVGAEDHDLARIGTQPRIL